MLFKVVGVTFDGRQETLKSLYEKYGKNPFEVTLVPEPENEFDANAIAVVAEDEQLGYLSKKDNSLVWDYAMSQNEGQMPSPVAGLIDHSAVGDGWERHLVFHAQIAVDI